MGDEAATRAAYNVQHFTDDMELRRCYEYTDPGEKTVWIIDELSMYIPEDIARHYYICRLSYDVIFPTLDAEALRGLPNIDYDLLSSCVEIAALQPMNKDATMRLCQQTIITEDYSQPYGQRLLGQAVAMVRETGLELRRERKFR